MEKTKKGRSISHFRLRSGLMSKRVKKARPIPKSFKNKRAKLALQNARRKQGTPQTHHQKDVKQDRKEATKQATVESQPLSSSSDLRSDLLQEKDKTKQKNARRKAFRRAALSRMTQSAEDGLAQDENFETALEVAYHVQTSKMNLDRFGNLTKRSISLAKDVVASPLFDTGQTFQPRQKEVDQQKMKQGNKRFNRFSWPKKRPNKQQPSGKKVKKETRRQVVRLVTSNPKASGILALILGLLGLLLVLMMGVGQGVAIQDEYDLNGTYLYMTKLDRERSTEKVEYWTNWEEPLLYINYNYDDLRKRLHLNPYGIMTDVYAGSLYVNNLWDGLNKDAEHLKTMKDLYSDKKSPFFLQKEERETYEEFREATSEFGTFGSLQELGHPFATLDSPEEEEAIQIVERFGYQSKDEIRTKSTLYVSGGQTIYAVMDGTIRIEGQNVRIETTDAIFTYFGMKEVRFKDGDKVRLGEAIGKSLPQGNLQVSYQKYLSYVPPSSILNLFPKEEQKWVDVNPGFYFKQVVYQETTLVSLGEVDADKAQKVTFAYNYLKKEVPEATIEGMSAVFGNFDVESSINPKRAEGDYLSPPVGATASSWDDPAWLSIDGPSIYNGRFPNILRRGLGLGQWTDTGDGAVRHTLLLQYAESKGKKWYDLELQLDFMLNGDSPYYRKQFRDILTSKSSVEDLTLRFLQEWEGNPGDKLQARIHSAKGWEAFLKGLSSGGPTVPVESVPEQYRDKLVYGLPSQQAVTAGQGYPGNAYDLGNCTWYVYNRFAQIGKSIYPYLGNAADWDQSAVDQGYAVSSKPKVGSAVVFELGVAGSHRTYGHVGFCEYVLSDGSFLISEMNFTGLYQVTWRIIQPQAGISFVTP